MYRRNGKLIDGQKVLMRHVEDCHEDQYMEIVDNLEQEMVEKEHSIMQGFEGAPN